MDQRNRTAPLEGMNGLTLADLQDLARQEIESRKRKRPASAAATDPENTPAEKRMATSPDIAAAPFGRSQEEDSPLPSVFIQNMLSFCEIEAMKELTHPCDLIKIASKQCYIFITNLEERLRKRLTYAQIFTNPALENLRKGMDYYCNGYMAMKELNFDTLFDSSARKEMTETEFAFLVIPSWLFTHVYSMDQLEIVFKMDEMHPRVLAAPPFGAKDDASDVSPTSISLDAAPAGGDPAVEASRQREASGYTPFQSTAPRHTLRQAPLDDRVSTQLPPKR